MLSYGSLALVKSITVDILADLLDVYPAQDAYAIMSIATLRVIRSSIACSRMSTHYNLTFIRVDYPGAALSPNSVCKLLKKVDGTLKQDTSKVNDSRLSHTKPGARAVRKPQYSMPMILS
jgi:hypothetical protein